MRYLINIHSTIYGRIQMSKTSIFQGISTDEKQLLLLCFQPQQHTYAAGETILAYTPAAQRLGILLSGSAALFCIDADGQQTTLEQLAENDVFGEVFLLPAGHMAYYVEAQNNSTALVIDQQRLTQRCEKACPHHSLFLSNLLQIAANKAQAQAIHINILSQRSVRKRLLTYFDILSQQNCGTVCLLPMSYSALAEYICADRSAMMRELKRMREEHLIETDGRMVRLCR